jgi:hypothetical protein
MPKEELSPLVMTIGHSTRTIEEFTHLLRVHGATCVVDVRTVPRSAHNPQFNKASLARYLKKFGLKYVHMPGLGGLAMRSAIRPTEAGEMPPFAAMRITCKRMSLWGASKKPSERRSKIESP